MAATREAAADPLRRAYRATDGWVQLDIESEADWKRLRAALGEFALANHQWDHHERHPADTGDYLPEFQLDISDDPRFTDRESRLVNAAALADILSEAFRHHTRREWLELLSARNIPCSATGRDAQQPA